MENQTGTGDWNSPENLAKRNQELFDQLLSAESRAAALRMYMSKIKSSLEAGDLNMSPSDVLRVLDEALSRDIGVQAYEARVRDLMEALRPFAQIGGEIDPDLARDVPVVLIEGQSPISVADVILAAKVYTNPAPVVEARAQWIDRIVDALLPFAKLGKVFQSKIHPDDLSIHGQVGPRPSDHIVEVTVGDLRRAAQALYDGDAPDFGALPFAKIVGGCKMATTACSDDQRQDCLTAAKERPPFLYLRCPKHLSVPALNENGPKGVECGACILERISLGFPTMGNFLGGKDFDFAGIIQDFADRIEGAIRAPLEEGELAEVLKIRTERDALASYFKSQSVHISISVPEDIVVIAPLSPNGVRVSGQTWEILKRFTKEGETVYEASIRNEAEPSRGSEEKGR